MSQLTEEIEKLKHDLFLHRDSPALRKRLAELLTDEASSFREEIAILARFDEAMREHPKIVESFTGEADFRCARCSRLLEVDWRPKLCRGCMEDERSEIRDEMYRGYL